jgi:phosphoglycerate dehydrogenase-like enzyme
MRKRMLCLTIAALFAATGLAGQNKKVLYLSRMGPEALKRMQAAVPSVTLVAGDRTKVSAQIADVDGVIGSINPGLIKSAPKLKWIQIESAGAEAFTFSEEFRKSQVTLTNCKILQGPEISDHAMALLLSLTRQINVAIRDGMKGESDKKQYTSIELRGKTAVVIGVGGIGTQIAIRANAHGMTVIGVDPKEIPYMPFLAKVVSPERLDTVLPSADVVFISAPLTRQSEGMMGARQFELMKRNSYFIAVSRGKLYDMNGLVKALDEKRLAGAGVDVTNPEPLPKGHPLWNFPNAIITPHVAGMSDGELPRDEELFIENLRRFGAGEPLLNVVDKEKGY